MKQRQDNSAAWAEIHAAARAEFPDAMNDPRRKEPGRAFWNKKNGMIQPSSPETVAACKASKDAYDRETARLAREAANLERHANDKARRRKQITADTNAKHVQETERRYQRQRAKVKDPNRYDWLWFSGAVVFVYGMIRLVMFLGGV